MSAYTQISITLPTAMLKDVARAQKATHTTRSEFFRLAVREHFLNNLPTEAPTKSERAAIVKGTAAKKSKNTISLANALHELER